jgi:uncharacterized protein (TIGR02145 family)
MARIINLLWAVCFALSGLAFLSCSSDDGGEKRKLSVGKTEDGKDVLVYQEGDLDGILIRIDTTSVSDTGFYGTMYFKDMKEEQIPNVGDIISSAETKGATYGFLFKALGVHTQDGITAVVVRDARLEEAIEDADVVSETEMEFDEEGNLMRVLQKSVGSKIGGTKVIDLTDNSRLTVEAAYSMKFNFDISIKKWKLKSAKMSLSQDGLLILRGTVKQKISNSIITPIASVKLPSIWVVVGLVPVCFANELDVNFKISGSAEVGMDVMLKLEGSGELGVGYSQDKGIYTIAESSFGKSFDYEQYIDGRVRVGLLLGLTTRLYGFAGLGFAAGPALELSVRGSPFGTHVFDEGFAKDYGGYTSIWANVEDRESIPKTPEGMTIANGINGYSTIARNNFDRQITNEVRLAFGTELSMRITLKILGHSLLDHEFAEKFIEHSLLYRTSFLPLFADLEITPNAAGTSIKVKSKIDRDFLNYPVSNYGLCLESSKDQCKNDGGDRKTFGSMKAGIAARSFEADFAVEAGKQYAIRPYFETGLGGVFFDKATAYPSSSSPSSSSVVVTPSSSSVVVTPSSSSVVVTPSSNSNACTDNSYGPSSPLTYEGQTYNTVKIGCQTWMAENLNYNAEGSRCYGEGAPVFLDIEKTSSIVLSAPEIENNCTKYGRLYDWATAKTACPSGWHLPSDGNWDTLMEYVQTDNGNTYSSVNLASIAGKYLKAASGWNNNGNGEDTYGFAALPGGIKEAGGSFYSGGTNGHWWSASESDSRGAYIRSMDSENGYVRRTGADKGYLRSIRCLKD